VLRGVTTKNQKTHPVPIATTRLHAVLKWLQIDAAGQEKPAEALVFSDETGEAVGRFRTAWVTAVLKSHGVKPGVGMPRVSHRCTRGDPNVDGARPRRISPLFNAGKIKVPLMVLQGVNDPRVLKVESDEIVAAARKNGVPVEYVLFPDEGHGFVKKDNETKGTQR